MSKENYLRSAVSQQQLDSVFDDKKLETDQVYDTSESEEEQLESNDAKPLVQVNANQSKRVTFKSNLVEELLPKAKETIVSFRDKNQLSFVGIKLSKIKRKVFDFTSWTAPDSRQFKFQDSEFDRSLLINRLVRIQNQENAYVHMKPLSAIEKAGVFEDNKPLLAFRKHVWYGFYQFQELLRKIVNHFLFEIVSLSVIIVNTVIYVIDASQTYKSGDATMSDRYELTFLVLFTTEIVIKILAAGFTGRSSFYKSPWNIFDMAVIVISWLSYLNIESMANYTFFRALRILRVYKILSSSRNLKLKISLFFSSIHYFFEIFAIMFFFYAMFAIIGLKLFSGVLQKRCVSPAQELLSSSELITTLYCINDSVCPKEMICKSGFINSWQPWTHFDNFFSSLFVSFQISLLEGWFQLQLNLASAFPQYLQPLAYLYFVFVIFVGNLFVLNLVKAIIIVKYNKSEKIILDTRFQRRAKLLNDTSFNLLQMKVCQYFNDCFYIQSEAQVVMKPFSAQPVILNRLSSDNLDDKNLGNETMFLQEKFENADALESSFKRKTTASLHNDSEIMGLANLDLKNHKVSKTPKDFAARKFSPYIMTANDQFHISSIFRPEEFNLLADVRKNADLERNFSARSKARSSGSKKVTLTNFLNTNDLKIDEQTIFALRKKDEIKESSFQKLLSKIKAQNEHQYKLTLSRELRLLPYEKFSSVNDVLPRSNEEYDKQQELFIWNEIQNRQLKMNYNFDVIVYEKANKANLMTRPCESESAKVLPKSKDGRAIYNSFRSVHNMTTIGVLLDDNKVNDRFLTHAQTCSLNYYYFDTSPQKMIIAIKFNKPVPVKQKSFRDLELHYIRSYISKISMRAGAIKSFFEREFSPLKSDEQIEFKKLISNLLVYQSVLEYDYLIGAKVSRVWSGLDVIDNKQILVEKLSLIFSQLSRQNCNIWLSGFWGNFKVFRGKVKSFMESETINYLILGLVIANTIVLCLYGLVDREDESRLDTANLVFTVCFITEMILKVFACGFKKYFKDPANFLDAVIVGFSVIELLDSGNSSSTSIRTLRLFRIFRVAKVIRLIRYLRFINVIIHVLVNSWKRLKYALIIMTTFVVMFSLIGFGLFNDSLSNSFQARQKTQNFDDIYESLIFIFNVLTTDNWDEGINTLLQGTQSRLLSSFFFFMWTFIGFLVVLNLFLAVVLEGFSEPSTVDIIKELSKEEKAIIILFENKVEITFKRFQFQKLADKLVRKFRSFNLFKQELSKKLKKSILRSLILQQNHKLDQIEEDIYENDESEELIDQMSLSEEIKSKGKRKKKTRDQSGVNDRPMCACSLFLFDLDNPFRAFTIRLVENIWFKVFIILIILLGCLIFVLMSYSPQLNQTTLETLSHLDVACNVLLLVEFGLKLIAYGFILCKSSYARSSWGLFDLVVVLFVMTDMLITDESNPKSPLRIVRATRIFRLISHMEYLKKTMNNLYDSLSAIGNVLVVMFLFFLVYAILGVSFLHNKMNYCADVQGNMLYGVSQQECSGQSKVWLTQDCNFDNILNALITLFVVSFLDNWQDVMFRAADAADETSGAIYRYNRWIYIYFVSFVLFVVFIIFNLGIGIIFVQFQIQEKEKRREFNQMNSEEQKLIHFFQLLPKTTPKHLRPSLHKSKLGSTIFSFYNRPVFAIIVNVMIVGSAVTLALSYEDMPESFKLALDIIQMIISLFFVLEAALKIYIQGSLYFYNHWSVFEFVLASLGVVDIILFLFMLTNPALEFVFQVYKITWIARVFRLFQVIQTRFFQELNKIMNTLILTISSILNILVMLALIYFFYAILAVTAFPEASIPEFENFGIAFLNMFRFSTGEGWSVVMWTLNKTYPFWGSLYFISFVFLTSYLLFNMVILILIDQFGILYFNPRSTLNLFNEHRKHFDQVWELFAEKHGGQAIKEHDLYNFFVCLKMPLGFNSTGDKLDKLGIYKKNNFSVDIFLANLRVKSSFIFSKLSNVRLPLYKGSLVYYHFVLFAALKIAFDFRDNQFREDPKPLLRTAEKEALNELKKKRINTMPRAKRQYAAVVMKPMFLRIIFEGWAKRSSKK